MQKSKASQELFAIAENKPSNLFNKNKKVLGSEPPAKKVKKPVKVTPKKVVDTDSDYA